MLTQRIRRKAAITSMFVTGLIALAAACSDGTGPHDAACEPGPYFTQLPVDGERISYFLVLGEINPPGDVFPQGQTGLQLVSADLTPAYAPGDVEITEVSSTLFLESPGRPEHLDYSLTFEIPECRPTFGVFHHLATLAPDLEARLEGATCETYSTESETVRTCVNRVEVPVTAGTVIGQAGGTITGLDFDLYDRRVTYDFVAGHRYPMARWAICPQHLFTPELRDFLLERTGRLELRRTAEPRCGTLEIDIPGTAQGMWVLDGHDVTLSATTFDRFFALAPHDIVPETHNLLATAHPDFTVDPIGYVVFSYRIEDEGRVNRPFAALPPDGTVHCFTPDLALSGLPTNLGVSFLTALGVDGLVTLERVDHPSGTSPCDTEPAAWAFSGAAVRLMR